MLVPAVFVDLTKMDLEVCEMITVKVLVQCLALIGVYGYAESTSLHNANRHNALWQLDDRQHVPRRSPAPGFVFLSS
jgi:hypothetical protein